MSVITTTNFPLFLCPLIRSLHHFLSLKSQYVSSLSCIMWILSQSVYFPPFHFFNQFSLSRTNTCFSYLNFKHLISFVIPGYERWDDSAIWKVQLSTGFWLGFHNISSCPWHIHGTCRNGHHMPSQICLGKTWFSLCLNMGCKSSFCRTTCRTSFCRNFMSFMYLLF